MENAYPILLEYTVINNIFGTTSGYAAFMDEADIREIFDNFSLTVTEGRLPEENSYELIMHEDMLKNKGLSVGDTFGSAVDEGEQIDGKYTITGAFSGDSYMAFRDKKATGRKNWKNWDWIFKTPLSDCLLHQKQI